MIHHIYVITCLVDHRQYVGITRVNPLIRLGWHYRDANRGFTTPLAAAIRQHGSMNFTIDHIACCPTKKDARAIEDALVAELGTLSPNGFNVMVTGAKLSTEWAAKIAAYNQRPEQRAKQSEVSRRYWASPGAREAHGEKIRAKNLDPAYRAANRDQLRAALNMRRKGPGARVGRTTSFVRHKDQLTLF